MAQGAAQASWLAVDSDSPGMMPHQHLPARSSPLRSICDAIHKQRGAGALGLHYRPGGEYPARAVVNWFRELADHWPGAAITQGASLGEDLAHSFFPHRLPFGRSVAASFPPELPHSEKYRQLQGK